MSKLRKQLKELEQTRMTQRTARERSGIATIALAGYTNAGKSSVLNALTGAGVLVQDALFATLDPTVRKITLPSGRQCTIADTVGFVRHLPHDLVEAFRSTLTEVNHADLIVHIVDGADEDPMGQVSAVREVLNDIGAGEIPELIVINKIDVADALNVLALSREFPSAVLVSAKTGDGIAELLSAIENQLPQHFERLSAFIPYADSDLVSKVHKFGENVVVAHGEHGTELTAHVPAAIAAELHTRELVVIHSESPQ
jgi:GTP-binding protein HflX